MSSPDLTDAEREAVAAVLRTPSLSMGGEILGFEASFREYTGLTQGWTNVGQRFQFSTAGCV